MAATTLVERTSQWIVEPGNSRWFEGAEPDWQPPEKQDPYEELEHPVQGSLVAETVVGKVLFEETVLSIDPLEAEIERSSEILTWPENWDDEGSSGYSRGTWLRAVEFLRRYSLWLRMHFDIAIQVPRILPGPQGSIDIHWTTPDHELLINIPADNSEPASFYGDNYSSATVKGSFNPVEINPGLLAWLLTYR